MVLFALFGHMVPHEVLASVGQQQGPSATNAMLLDTGRAVLPDGLANTLLRTTQVRSAFVQGTMAWGVSGFCPPQGGC